MQQLSGYDGITFIQMIRSSKIISTLMKKTGYVINVGSPSQNNTVLELQLTVNYYILWAVCSNCNSKLFCFSFFFCSVDRLSSHNFCLYMFLRHLPCGTLENGIWFEHMLKFHFQIHPQVERAKNERWISETLYNSVKVSFLLFWLQA